MLSPWNCFSPTLKRSKTTKPNIQSHKPAPARPGRPSSDELDSLAAMIGPPIKDVADEASKIPEPPTTPEKKPPLPLSMRRARSTYRRYSKPRLPTIPDASVEGESRQEFIRCFESFTDMAGTDLKANADMLVTKTSKDKGKGIKKELPHGRETPEESAYVNHYGQASTWPVRKADWHTIVEEWTPELPHSISSLTDVPEPLHVQKRFQHQELGRFRPSLQPTRPYRPGWQSRVYRSCTEDAGEASSSKSPPPVRSWDDDFDLLSPPNSPDLPPKINTFNRPEPPSDWVCPSSAWSVTTAASIRSRKGLRSRLRSSSFMKAIRRAVDPDNWTPAELSRLVDAEDAKLSAVRGKTHRVIVAKRQASLAPVDQPKPRHQDVLVASASFRKRLLRRSLPDEIPGSSEEALSKPRPTSLPSEKATKLEKQAMVVPRA